MAINNVTSNTADAAKKPVAPQNSAAAAKSASVAKAGMNAYAKATQPPTMSEAANVQISPKAKEMSAAKKIVDETPEIREDKVAKFKDLIAKGQYKPDSSKIAEGILREAIKDDLAHNPEVALED